MILNSSLEAIGSAQKSPRGLLENIKERESNPTPSEELLPPMNPLTSLVTEYEGVVRRVVHAPSGTPLISFAHAMASDGRATTSSQPTR